MTRPERRMPVRNANSLTRAAFLSAQAHEEYKAAHAITPLARHQARLAAAEFRTYRIARWGRTEADIEDERSGRYREGRFSVTESASASNSPEASGASDRISELAPMRDELV